jgi:hypothetical protein
MTAPDVPMPRDLTEREVARWLQAEYYGGPMPWPRFDGQARAVLALVEAKVREGIRLACDTPADELSNDEIVARVMNKEAPRV